MAYEVRTAVYEGPFDLLLHLILQEEVDLWEVSLHGLVDAFLTEVEAMGTIDLDVATQFLLVAATLIELKARRLLPGMADAELDEELLRFEERDLLLARLLECKTFKDVASMVESRLRLSARSIPRTVGPEEPFRSLAPDPLERTTLEQLRAAAVRAFSPKEEPPEIVDLFHVQPIRTSVREAIDAVLVVLPRTGVMSFRAIVAGIEDRMEVIVRFLAVLELFKQGQVDLTQVETFGDLTVRRLDEGERALDLSSIDDWEDTIPEVAVEKAAAERIAEAAEELAAAERIAEAAEELAAADESGDDEVEVTHHLDATPESAPRVDAGHSGA